jgi:hypothetical protein
LILASPSRQAHPQRDRRPLSRQILQPANLPAVTTRGLDITYRTSSAPLAEGQDRPATVVALRPKKLEAGSQSPFGILDHATIGPVCSKAVKPDPRSHEVRKTRPESFEPLFVRSWDGEVDAQPWCMGFYALMKLRLLAWSRLISPDRIEHYLLLPILFHCVNDAGQPALPPAMRPPGTRPHEGG